MSVVGTQVGVQVFATAFGDCGIAWRDDRLAAVQLPEASAAATRARLLRRIGGDVHDAVAEALPEPLAAVVAAIQQLLAGGGDLGKIDAALCACPLADDGLTPFHRDVYAAARAVAPGRTCTYGELATAAGAPGLARAVGQAMARNPYPIVVPCHRVLGADGRMTGFSAHGGIATKRRLLALEGVREPTTLSLFAEESPQPSLR